ncbi:hypothetical protein IAT38_001514 [Cryptococcus sp. DSM 104549]
MLGHLPRFLRLTLLVTLLIVVPTLYLLYPSPERQPSPGEYQAGGIDSPHWRAPVKPDLDGGYEREEGRGWGDELVVGGGGRQGVTVNQDVINGGVIMPKLGNATAKAELGRAAWRVLHLMTLRYPDNPTEDDRLALKSYFHLFSRLYPCGECATEFQALLKEYPPQTSSRKSASLWLCHVHNLVNARLEKPEFDCLTLDETYDCGCGDDPSASTSSSSPGVASSHVAENDEERGAEHTRGIADEEIFALAGSALDGEFKAAAAGEGVDVGPLEGEVSGLGVVSDDHGEGDEEVVAVEGTESAVGDAGEGEGAAGTGWRKSQVAKENLWELEKAEHGVE